MPDTIETLPSSPAQEAETGEAAPPPAVKKSLLPAPIVPIQPYPSMPALGYQGRESWSAGEVGMLFLGGVVFMVLVARYLGLWGGKKKHPPGDGDSRRKGRPHRPF